MIDGNERQITMDDIMKALKRIKAGKAAGYYSVSSEMLRDGVSASHLSSEMCSFTVAIHPIQGYLFVILVSSACRLKEMVKTNDFVKRRDTKVNVGKTKEMVFKRGESMTLCDILIEDEKVEQVKEFSNTWVVCLQMMKKNESRINAVEMRSLRSMCGVSRKDRCRNSDVRKRSSLKEDIETKVERDILR
ncbi:hypothetical protein EVAR_63926_1 [Eumeta japonica]|uniref:Uncharacterized protein n=1 Tax=Eumeta variegata TaxID=151549 RepID=A0A4C1ZK28_EUMVA|nr:hypothetical protein EVAR_63926_1 [Eumeta japonica]